MLGRTDSRLRLVLLLLVMAVGAGALGLRLAYWQIGVAPELQRMADSQMARPVVADIERGKIVDRRGTVLATTGYRDSLAAYPDVMKRAGKVDQVVAGLASILGYDAARRQELLTTINESNGRYLNIERRLTQEQSDMIRAGLESESLVALGLEAHPVRFYPSPGGAPGTTLANQLLGFVTDDGQGRYGIEQASDELLAGSGGPTANAAGQEDVPTTGGSVQLTIDASLQLALENELQAAYVADKAHRVSGVIMDPYTGAILAWASVPGYDANDYGATANRAPQMFTDPIVSEVYEPGSVMKMFTAAAAIEKGVVGPQTLVEDSRTLLLGDNVVRNFDRRSMGVVPFEDAIAHSRNVATGRVALMLGQTTEEASTVLYDMWQRLGIGKPTGIELSNEADGIDHPPTEGEWLRIDLVNRAFGQSVAVTQLQLARSFAAMINGGL
ncbi:MAG TPA: penicillin-binding transpeptidase domain-containing protein, partial [Candidatus Limnocylindrales bacterium]|nr:penicillin-binding transpeptidase domain-containing protein [Candidatus Limnocylindrales bacterium]